MAWNPFNPTESNFQILNILNIKNNKIMPLEGNNTQHETDYCLQDIMKSLDNIHHSVSSFRDSHLIHAQLLNENDPNEEIHKIYHLVEAHCPVFRNNAINLFSKASRNVSHKVFPMDSEHLAFHCCTETAITGQINGILNKMELMPSEWTLVQLTSLHLNTLGPMEANPLQITIFQCGQTTIKPFTVEVNSPEDSWGNSINILRELNATCEVINKGYVKIKGLGPGGLKETYSEYKCRINNTMKQYVKDVQNKWLGKWRCLLTGRFSDQETEEKIEKSVVCLLQEHQKSDVSMKSRQILKYMLRAQAYIDSKETKKLLKYCFPDISKDEVISALNNIKGFEAYGKAPRNPVILIVDATIDQVPWEMLDVFANQAVSRMQSFYITYALFDAHESEIVNGRKIIRAEGVQGGAMLNPSLNLPRMEKRLSAFHSYWTKEWRIMIGKRPTEAEFLDFVTNCDIFDYSGHGDGMQYIKQSSLEKLRINAVVFLFGCRSVAFKQQSPFVEPWGSSQYYTMCCCPCVVGNLYNVTDFECDVMCTTLLSQWVPGPGGKPHWLDIDLKQWEPGNNNVNIETLPKLPSKNTKQKQFSDMLLALNKTKCASNISYVTQAACVARGIPVKLI